MRLKIGRVFTGQLYTIVAAIFCFPGLTQPFLVRKVPAGNFADWDKPVFFAPCHGLLLINR